MQNNLFHCSQIVQRKKQETQIFVPVASHQRIKNVYETIMTCCCTLSGTQSINSNWISSHRHLLAFQCLLSDSFHDYLFVIARSPTSHKSQHIQRLAASVFNRRRRLLACFVWIYMRLSTLFSSLVCFILLPYVESDCCRIISVFLFRFLWWILSDKFSEFKLF